MREMLISAAFFFTVFIISLGCVKVEGDNQILSSKIERIGSVRAADIYKITDLSNGEIRYVAYVSGTASVSISK